MEQTAYQIDLRDNVATALGELVPGTAILRGDAVRPRIPVTENIPRGHKLALRDIAAGEKIIKYGVVIGEAAEDIREGSWVHLHVMRSLYDERSGHLDVHTGAPKDTCYE